MPVTSAIRSQAASTSIAGELHARALGHMPLGVADNYRFWGKDQTVFVATTAGPGITDVDGNDYIDFRLAYGPIILGYRDRRIDNAVIHCIREAGVLSGFSSALESDVAESIKVLCPNIEKLRFANSGTEAVMGALRCARGFTGRDTVVVVEGGFHGLCDEMMWKADMEGWDSSRDPAPMKRPFGRGIATASGDHVMLVPLNDEGTLQALFAERGDRIAAVLIEPIMGNCGSITATPDYLRVLKDLCTSNGSLLIFDEVKTGFRVAKGGVQELMGVYADLTTYAKALGNGYPIAAFGGRADVMDVISTAADGVVHGGTYTANMIGLTAAKATLGVLQETDALKTVAETGKQVMRVLAEAFDSFGLPYVFAGHSSMFGVHFMTEELTNYRDWKKSDSALYRKFARNMIASGVMLEPDSREPWFICEAHAALDLNWLSTVTRGSLESALRRG